MPYVIHRYEAELGLESVSCPPASTTRWSRRRRPAQPSVTVAWVRSGLWSRMQGTCLLMKAVLCSWVSPAHQDRPLTSSTTLPTWVIPPLPLSMAQATPPQEVCTALHPVPLPADTDVSRDSGCGSSPSPWAWHREALNK